MKVTNYTITATDAYIGCEDVPSSICCETPCNECPFNDESVTIVELIKKYMEVYNADN